MRNSGRPDPVLSAACHRGILAAASHQSQPSEWLRSLDRRLTHAQSVAQLDLCAKICSVLEDLAHDEAKAGRTEDAAYWLQVARWVMARAWQREFGPDRGRLSGKPRRSRPSQG